MLIGCDGSRKRPWLKRLGLLGCCGVCLSELLIHPLVIIKESVLNIQVGPRRSLGSSRSIPDRPNRPILEARSRSFVPACSQIGGGSPLNIHWVDLRPHSWVIGGGMIAHMGVPERVYRGGFPL